MENKSARLLKANTVEAFKPQKLKKNNNQCGKAKSFINTDEINKLNNSLSSQRHTQGEFRDYMFKKQDFESGYENDRRGSQRRRS